MSRRSSRPLAWFVAGTAAVLGGSLALLLWRRWQLPVRARRRDVAHVPTGPVEVVDRPGQTPSQHPEDGAGPRFHRRYHVDVAEPQYTPEALMQHIGNDLQAFSPSEIARFEKTKGAAGALAVGDEFMVHISSPWNGPVRVVEVTPTSFTLATLEGHMEAGEIRFSAAPHPMVPGALRFTIESWARSRDGIVDLFYDTLGAAQKAQEVMWTFYCSRVAEAAGGRQMGEIEVLTEREVEGEEGVERKEGERPR